MGSPSDGNGSVHSAPGHASHLMLEGHEDRLQRVEQQLGECSRAIGVAAIRIDGLGQQMIEGNAAIIERINSGFASVHDRLGRTESEVKNVAGSLSIQRREVAELRAKSLGRTKLIRKLRNLGIAAALSGGSWAAGHFGDVAWKWLSR